LELEGSTRINRKDSYDGEAIALLLSSPIQSSLLMKIFSTFVLCLLPFTFCQSERPNIVVFLSDDMGWEQVGYNGGKEVPTPAIDSLAREGVKLTQFYVQPVCSPSRASLLTGRYPWKNGMEERPTAMSKHGMLLDERTIAEALRDTGYATWMVGKWHLGEWQHHHLPNQRGFDHHYGLYSAMVDSFVHLRTGVLDWHRNGVPIIEEGYSTFLLANEASRLIAEHDDSQPFFLYLPFNAVHKPHQAPEAYIEKYEHLGDVAAQRAQLECMDLAIAQVLHSLELKGIVDNTLVIFTNDNGGLKITSNGPYRGYKGDYHEGGIRVPTAIRWPGKIPAGSTNDAMVHIMDLFPTICNLVGAQAEKELPLDGKDIWNVIAQGGESPHSEIVHSLEVIRRGDWKFIEKGASYYDWKDQELQLYNIAKDPSETLNLAAENQEVVKELRTRLVHHKQFARIGEAPSVIPGYPVTVYGEQEEARHADTIQSRMEELKLLEHDVSMIDRERYIREAKELEASN